MKPRYLACLIFLLSSAAPAVSQSNDAALIDQQLRGQLDLRDTRFSSCYGRAACTVDGFRVSAWRKNKSPSPGSLHGYIGTRSMALAFSGVVRMTKSTSMND